MAKAILTISSKNYSSWSLRGWLMTGMSGLDFEEQVVLERHRRRALIAPSRSPRYLLSIVLTDGGKVPLGQWPDIAQVAEIADAMADVANTKVVMKE